MYVHFVCINYVCVYVYVCTCIYQSRNFDHTHHGQLLGSIHLFLGHNYVSKIDLKRPVCEEIF